MYINFFLAWAKELISFVTYLLIRAPLLTILQKPLKDHGSCQTSLYNFISSRQAAVCQIFVSCFCTYTELPRLLTIPFLGSRGEEPDPCQLLKSVEGNTRLPQALFDSGCWEVPSRRNLRTAKDKEFAGHAWRHISLKLQDNCSFTSY